MKYILGLPKSQGIYTEVGYMTACTDLAESYP